MLEAWVGLRPGRSTVRLEREVMKFNNNLGDENTLKVSLEYITDYVTILKYSKQFHHSTMLSFPLGVHTNSLFLLCITQNLRQLQRMVTCFNVMTHYACILLPDILAILSAF